MTLYASLGQVRISVAALAADFLDEVGGHLHHILPGQSLKFILP